MCVSWTITTLRRHHLVLLFVVILLWALVSTESAPQSPITLGLRAALCNRRWLQHGPSTDGKWWKASSFRHLLVDCDKHCDKPGDHDDHRVETAFLRQTTQSEKEEGIYSVTYAYLRHRCIRDEPQSEIELLESTMQAGLLGGAFIDDRHFEMDLRPSRSAWSSSPLYSRIRVVARSALHFKTKGDVTHPSTMKNQSNDTVRGGIQSTRPLVFWENMLCGAISRSVAQTVMHPANTMKTILQSSKTPPTIAHLATDLPRLWYGAGANFLLSVPHGAINFAVLEFVRKRLDGLVNRYPVLAERSSQLGPGLDFLSSCISTITCSVVSTPQMVITDNIMAGNYPNLSRAVASLSKERGIKGFYRGWWPGLAGKIPSYALTWTFFQQLKIARDRITGRPARNIENSIMGSIASATTVCIMIPMDTIKTRLVTQAGGLEYKGIIDCATRIYREEGIRAFYRGLPPRLLSVVPMIGIQFGVYEFAKRLMIEHTSRTRRNPKSSGNGKERKAPSSSPPGKDYYSAEQIWQEAAMEVAASLEQPFPAPHFHETIPPPTTTMMTNDEVPRIKVKNSR